MVAHSKTLSYAIRLSIAIYMVFSFLIFRKARIHSPNYHEALLLKSKQDFIRNKGETRKGSEIVPKSASIISDILPALHRPVSEIFDNPKLPEWVERYASFHAQQRQKYFDDMRANSTSDVRFLISRCLTNDKCGGASDRLQDIPYNLMLANQTNRVLLVKWEKPAALENFLVPPKDGIDWTIPDDMFSEGDNWHLRGKEDSEHKVVSTIRKDSAAPLFRKYQEEDLKGTKM